MSRPWFFALVLVPVFLLALAPTSRAAKAAPEAGHSATPAAGGEGATEDKIDVFGGNQPLKFQDFLDLGIWTLVVFLVLVFVLGRYAWKPMLEGLRQREQNIKAAVEEAQRAREEAQQLRVQFQEQMNQANEQVRQLLEQGRRDTQRLRDEMLEQTRNEIRGERERLHREIDTARDQALHQIWAKAAELATAISGKVLRRSLTPDDQRRLVDEALAEMPQGGNGQRPAAG